MNRVTPVVLLAGFMTLSTPGSAAPFDGSKNMLCATQYVSQCDTGADCVNVTPESVNLPDFIHIDVAGKLISPTPESGREATTPIERSEILDGKLMLQGADDGVEDVRDGLGWTIAINEETGKMVISASGDGFATVVFGACTLQ
jgi:hypothetical protein